MDLRSSQILSIASGGGGLDLAIHRVLPDARTVCYVENEIEACGVLAYNMEQDALAPAPIWTNVHTFDGKPWRGIVDGIIAGYPCQPFSIAGKKAGPTDPRHLWPAILRVIQEVAPTWCFFENVYNHIQLGLREVVTSLDELGYVVGVLPIKANTVGAPHGRPRVFILVVDPRQRIESGLPNILRTGWSRLRDSSPRSMAVGEWPPKPLSFQRWRSVVEKRPDLQPALERSLLGVDDGLARGLDQNSAKRIAGNGVVPMQAAAAFVELWRAYAERS